jgi:predicted Zn-dependent protease
VVQSDDQLATVISHETAHALAHHSSERVARKEMNHGGLGVILSKAYAKKNRKRTTSACS